MNNIQTYLENLSKDAKEANYEVINGFSDDERLMFLYAYYHYFNADDSNFDELLNGDVYEYNSQDGITGVYHDPDSDSNDVDILVSMYLDEDEEFYLPTVLNRIKCAEIAAFSARDEKEGRKDIKNLFVNDNRFSKDRPLTIHVVTNFNPKNASKKKSIIKAISELGTAEEYVSYKISFGFDIEFEILEIEDPKEYVDKATLQIDKNDNILLFGSEKSMIVNISAKSLKSAYEQYGYRGLFAQNLRYYVKNAKIDNNIISSIIGRPSLFWYLNNGIIIICDSYVVRGNSIIVKKFSIINGGQTTKLIGECDFDKDFFVQCKIIKNKYSDEDQKVTFIADVAEASNTQKPIKGKDIIANRLEQRQLKKQLAKAGIYCQIKRGEKINKKLYPNAWQNTTNEEIGQFLLAFTYQKPGAARANKASICGNAERYNLLFSKQYNSGLLGDLLKIKAYYKMWATHTKKYDKNLDEYKVGLSSYGMFYVTAIIGILVKIYYHSEYLCTIKEARTLEQKMEILSQHDIDHYIFNKNMTKEDYFELFDFCYSYFYMPGYDVMKQQKLRYNSFANFTKVESNFVTYIFPQIWMTINNGIPKEISDYFDEILYSASEAEKKRDAKLLKKYINVTSGKMNQESSLPEDVVKIIKENLIDYRNRVIKKYNLKSFEVYSGTVVDRISLYAPTSLTALTKLHCLNEYQLKTYGKDIVLIVKNSIWK